MKSVKMVLLAVILASCALVWPATGGIGVSAKVGTTGVGGELTMGISSNFGIRAGYSWFSFRARLEDSSNDSDSYDIDLKLQTLPILLDWHPWKGEFRISAGAVFNGNKLVVSAEQGSTIDIGDGEYTIESLEGKATFPSFVPYAGIGYGNAADKRSRWHFAFDAGVIFQGQPDIELKAQAANPLLQPLLEMDVKREEEDIEDEASAFTIYPVVSFGVSFCF